MKLDFIVEASLEDLEAKKPYLIKTYCQEMKSQREVDDYLSAAASCDPTNGKYIEWILNHIRDRNIRLPEDAEKILNVLDDFNKRKTRLSEKDIHRYNPNSLYKALNEIETVTRGQRKAAYRGNLVVPPGAEILDIDVSSESQDLVVMRLNNASATMTIASGTNWCVANEASANDYLEAGPLYAFYKNGKKHALLCVPDAFFFASALERFQYNNTDNDPLPSDQTAAVMRMVQPYTHISPDKYPPLQVMIARGKDEFPSLSDSFFHVPSNAVACAEFYNRRWIEAEPIIKTDLHAAIEYLLFAQTVSNTKYLEAYQEDPDDDDTSGSRGEESETLEWPDIEGKIATSDDDKLVFRYVDVIAEEETPKLEARVFRSARTPEMIDCVIRYVTKFPDSEPRVPEDVINIIAQDGMLSYNFAEAIESRFKLGEKAISSDNIATVAYYLKGFVVGRWPAAELNCYNRLLGDSGETISNLNLGDLYVYAALLAKERVPITETALLRRLRKHDFKSPSNPLAASIIKYYAQFFYPNVWPDLLEISRSFGISARNKRAIRDFFEFGFLACRSKSDLKIEGEASFLLSLKFDSLLSNLRRPLSDMNQKIDKYFI